MATVAILGGGISGLSCAYYLKTLGKTKIKYLFLLEKSPKFGGWIQTTRFPDGAVFEHGPRTLRIAGKQGYNAVSLAEELGLTSQILPITKDHSAAKNRYILVNNKLIKLPNSFGAFLRAVPPFPKSMCGYVLKDLMTKKTVLSDESMYSFGERRFGKEVADYIFDPMCRGISAGDAKDVSIRSMLPNIFNSEQEHGSIVKGAIKNMRNVSLHRSHVQSKLAFKSHREFWRMWSLKRGLNELVETLACAIEEKGIADIHVNAECTGLTFQNNKAMVAVDGENIEVDHIFSSIPSPNLAKLLSSFQSLSDNLSSIPAVSVALVYLEYEQNVLKHEGFGFLTPSSEDAKVLGITFDSCCFPEHNGTSSTRITCMMGGKWFKETFGDLESVTNEQVLKVAISEAKRHLGIAEPPVRHQVLIQKDCIPQYLVGHHKKLEAIAEEIKSKDLCLTLLGASYAGAGLPDCIYNAKLVVEKYLETFNKM